MQEKCARVLIPTEDGLFGAGDGGLGFGAEMGKANGEMSILMIGFCTES